MFSDDRAGTIVVVTALNSEYDAMRLHIRNVQVHVHKSGTVFETGELVDSSRRIVLVNAGTGNQSAAVLTERAISEFAPVAVLVVGIAGAIDPEINLGDVVVGTKVYAVHGGKEDSNGLKARPDSWHASHTLEQLAHLVARTPMWSRSLPHRPRVLFKPIAAGEVVLNSRDSPLAQQIDRHYNDTAAIEMESAGVAAAAHRNHGLPMLAVRGISDKADGTKRPADDARWQPVAARNAAAFAVGIANQLTSAPAREERPVLDRMAPVLSGLALAVGQQWQAEQERRSIQDPGPLALRWAVPDGQSGRFDELGLFFARLRSHRLVILGRSGSGKTASVSQLVLDLLALRSAQDPVPVLFSLGAWDPAKQRLPEWMIGQLLRDHPRLGRKEVSGTGPKRTVAATLVETGQILPVLDGLDEVPEAMRGKAIDAINRLGSDLPLVVTSRTDEYRDAVPQAERELSRAVIVELQSLDPADVCRYLSEGTGERWQAVTKCLATHPEGQLARVLSTPLMVWLARVTYGAPGKIPDELCTQFTSEEAVESHLLEHLVPAVYPDHPTPGGRGAPPGGWSAAEARHGLKFLARHLVETKQPDLAWWRLHQSVPHLSALCMLLTVAVMTVGASVAAGTLIVVVVIMAIGVLGMQMVSPRWRALMAGKDPYLTHPSQFNARNLPKELLRVLVSLLLAAAAVLSMMIAVVGVSVVPLTSFRAIAVISVFVLISVVLAGWWFLRMRKGKRSKRPETVTLIDLERAVSAGSSLRADREAALYTPVVLAVLLIPPCLLVVRDFVPLIVAACVGWVTSTAYFRFSVTRAVLALRGRLPWRLMRFLDDAHERGVLRQVGAVYQFRHDRLMDRLSA